MKHAASGLRAPRLRRLILPLVLALAACSSGTRSYVHPNMDFSYMRRCAVLPFHNISSDNHAGDRVQTLFTMALLEEGALLVVEPGEVEAAMQRLRLPTGQELTPDQYVELGGELDVDALFLGTVEEYGIPRTGGSRLNEVTANFGMVETQTGTIVWQAQVHKTGGSLWRSLSGGSSASIHDVSEAAVESAMETLF